MKAAHLHLVPRRKKEANLLEMVKLLDNIILGKYGISMAAYGRYMMNKRGGLFKCDSHGQVSIISPVPIHKLSSHEFHSLIEKSPSGEYFRLLETGLHTFLVPVEALRAEVKNPSNTLPLIHFRTGDYHASNIIK